VSLYFGFDGYQSKNPTLEPFNAVGFRSVDAKSFVLRAIYMRPMPACEHLSNRSNMIAPVPDRGARTRFATRRDSLIPIAGIEV